MSAAQEAHEYETSITQAPRLRVVHVVLSLECGGLEQVVLDLVRGGGEIGQKVSVICVERKGVLAEKLETAGVAVHACEKSPGLHIRRMRRDLRRLFCEIRPDVVHTHQVGALFYAGPAAKSVGVPVVVHTEHGKHYEHRAKTRWLGRYAARFTDRYCCVSKDIAANVIRHRITALKKVEYVPNGIDARRFSAGGGDATALKAQFGIEEEAKVVGTIGRLAKIKQQDLLIQAFSQLKAAIPKAHLLIVGDGPERQSLEHLARDLGLAGCTHFTGYRDDREKLLQIMDVFVLSSRSEGMPLSVLEAWAAGVPTVAASVGGIPELIEDGRTGLLIEGTNPKVWSDAIASVLTSRSCMQGLVDESRNLVLERYSLEVMVSRYERQYRDALSTNDKKRN